MPVPSEQAAMRRICELRDAGASTHQIADTLTAEGHPTKRGGRWASATVSRILARQPKPVSS
ncbi:recombinase family protein [Mycolicibacterium elephantis]|uniref:recombinase family protein n=1 Tax=Mycolicibacterium elephantis TaxID=81858 RepID=UPI0027B95893|nr:recombinase family protein [Mycolicibacterium elephantis]